MVNPFKGVLALTLVLGITIFLQGIIASVHCISNAPDFT
ncbi:hypothetical protein [Nostoc sp. NMS7]